MSDTSKAKPRRCRCLTVAEQQCQKNALAGENFCVHHKQHRRPVCPQKDAVEMPLLEDLSAIQLVASQVAHGLFTETIDPRRAGKILYACQVAAMTMARPGPVKAEPAGDEGRSPKYSRTRMANCSARTGGGVRKSPTGRRSGTTTSVFTRKNASVSTSQNRWGPRISLPAAGSRRRKPQST